MSNGYLSGLLVADVVSQILLTLDVHDGNNMREGGVELAAVGDAVVAVVARQGPEGGLALLVLLEVSREDKGSDTVFRFLLELWGMQVDSVLAVDRVVLVLLIFNLGEGRLLIVLESEGGLFLLGGGDADGLFFLLAGDEGDVQIVFFVGEVPWRNLGPVLDLGLLALFLFCLLDPLPLLGILFSAFVKLREDLLIDDDLALLPHLGDHLQTLLEAHFKGKKKGEENRDNSTKRKKRKKKRKVD